MHVLEDYNEGNDTHFSWMPWLVCLAASLFFFYEFIQGNMFASIADDIMRDFQIQANSMAYLSSIYYFSNVIFLFVAGFILDRFSSKRTIILAMLLCVLSTFLLARAESFYLAMFCRFVTGIGSAFCFLGPVRIASRWFPARRMALVTGLIVTIAMTGGMVSQYPMTCLVAEVGWRSALQYVAWLGMAMLFLMLFLIKDSPVDQASRHLSSPSLLQDAKRAYCNVQSLRAALYTSLMNMGIAVFGAMMGSLYLMQRLGISKSDAALINSMLFLGMIIGGPLMGWCSDRLGLRVLPMKIGALLALAIMMVILYLPVTFYMMAVLFFFLGLFTGAQVISYALVAESSPPHITATAVSLVSIMTQGGYVLYQNLFGFLLTQHGGMHMEAGVPVYTLADYQFASMILPMGLILAYVILKGLNESYCKPISG